MRRKAIIVLAITFMVTVMVASFSYLYISQILRQRITNAYESASRLTQQLAYFAGNDLPDLSSTRVDTNDPAAVRRALAEYLPMDTNILNSLESQVALLALHLRCFHRGLERQSIAPHQSSTGRQADCPQVGFSHCDDRSLPGPAPSRLQPRQSL